MEKNTTKVNVPKLEDANEVGEDIMKNAYILTKGDWAKALAISSMINNINIIFLISN